MVIDFSRITSIVASSKGWPWSMIFPQFSQIPVTLILDKTQSLKFWATHDIILKNFPKEKTCLFFLHFMKTSPELSNVRCKSNISVQNYDFSKWLWKSPR